MRAKRVKDIITIFFQVLEDPGIIGLRKKLERRRLQRAIDELEGTPKIIDLAEKLTKIYSLQNICYFKKHILFYTTYIIYRS
jgi:hypothetical protein